MSREYIARWASDNTYNSKLWLSIAVAIHLSVHLVSAACGCSAVGIAIGAGTGFATIALRVIVAGPMRLEDVVMTVCGGALAIVYTVVRHIL